MAKKKVVKSKAPKVETQLTQATAGYIPVIPLFSKQMTRERIMGVKAPEVLSKKSPLASRAEHRAITLRLAVDKIINNLKTYQDSRAVRDLDPYVETTLRISIETLTKQVELLNAPSAPYAIEKK